MVEKLNVLRLATGTIILLVLFYCLVALSTGPSVFWDSGYGFMIWQSMERGACFNCLIAPNRGNIAKDTFAFIAAWSPGQYLVPAILFQLGMTLGKAVVVTTTICSIVGLTGFFYLYKSVGFSSQVALVACLVITATRGFSVQFNTYHGGEILLFAIAPWALLLCVKYRNLPTLSWPLFVMLFLLGVFFKLSFTIFAVAVLSFLLLWKFMETQSLKNLYPLCLRAGMVFLVFYWGFYVLFLSKGKNPSQLTGLEPSAFLFLFSAISPFTSALSVGDLVMRVFRFSGWEAANSVQDLWWVLVLLTPLAAWICIAIYKNSAQSYRALLLSFLVIYFGLMSLLYMGGVGISFEDRHFRTAGLVIVPGLISLVGKLNRKKSSRYILAGVIICCCFYGIGSFVIRVHRNRNSPQGMDGIAFAGVSPSVLREIQRLDSQSGSGDIICVPSPDLALEVRQARRIVAPAEMDDMKVLSALQYRGNTKHVSVFLPTKFVRSGTAFTFLSSFKDYRREEWSAKQIADYTLFQAVGNTTVE